METLFVTNSVQIPLGEIEFSFARSGGPGGQNVNKVNTKALLRWSIQSSSSLPGDVRARFMNKFASRVTLDGELVLTSQRYRDQSSNAEDCLSKLRQMLEEVATPPTPRRATRPSLASKNRRIEGKTKTSAKKQSRQAPRYSD